MLLADICFTHYKIIKASVILQLVTSALAMMVAVTWAVWLYLFQQPHDKYFTAIALVIEISMVVSTGMFEANAIQFGMDQMLEASSDQLSTFIHWYYWSMSLSAGLLSGITIAALGVVMTGSCVLHTMSPVFCYVS